MAGKRVVNASPGASGGSDGAPASPALAGESRALAAWELVSVAVSTLIAEWAVLALSSNKLLLAVPVVCAFGLMFASHRLRGETLRDLGWRVDNFMGAARLLLLPMLAAQLRWASSAGSGSAGSLLSASAGGVGVFGFPVWGFAWGFLQQCVLQSSSTAARNSSSDGARRASQSSPRSLRFSICQTPG
jgi:hypothetical protein